MTPHSRSLLGILAVGFLLLALPSYASWQQEKRGELPKDEQKLLEYAQTRMNNGDWKESDRAYKAYLDRFPDGKNLEQVYVNLGNLHHWYSNQYATSREWYLKACEKFPKSPNYWNYRFQAAQTWQNQNLKEKALEEYRKIAKEAPDAQVRTSAIQQAWSVEGKYFYMHVNQSFTSGQEPFVHVQLAKIDKIVFRAEHIKFDAILAKLGQDGTANLHDAIDKVGKEGRRELKEWTATYTYEKNNYWKQEQVKVPSTESGVYVVQGEHDGVVMTVTLFVSQYGIITKSSAGKLLCFAQDRATSKPVEGMTIRTLNAQNPLNGTTDANGVYVGENFQGGVVVGVKGTELVTTESSYGGAQGEHPLIYVTTDRPIYRPNHTVQFRVVHRSELGQKLLVKPGEKFLVEIRDPKGNKVYEKLHSVGDFGSTSGQMVLGDEPALGEYTILTRGEKDEPNLHQWNWQWMGRWGNQAWNGVRFRVDEYRKPEYKVDVSFKKRTVLQGEDVEATVESRYYFGSPVADAEVTYTVMRRGYWYFWRCWDFYYDWYVEDENEGDGIYEGKQGRRPGRGYYGGEQVLQGKGKTDKNGKFVIPFTSQKWEHDAVYDVQAQVTDLSRRVVEGGGSCKATRAEFGLAMSLNKYVYKPGDKINARVRATTADDKEVADQKITIKGYDRRWRNGNYDDAFLFEGSSKTDAHGIAEFNFTPERDGGYLWLVAEAEDRRGNKVSTEHWVWLCGDSWYGDTVNLNGLDLILDKKTYDVGDTAHVLVTSQHKNVTFLFTVEGKEIHQQQVVALKGHTKMIDFKIDQSWYAPNVYISVAAIKENAFIQKSKMIVVNPSEKFIKVEIKPDKAQYRPRNKARYEIVTTGADGKPVAAEVAFGIVDDSIYALQDEYAPDVRKFFIHRRGIEVATSNSLQYYDYGRADEKRKSAGESGNAFGAKAEMDAAKPATAPMAQRAAGKEAKDGEGGAAYAATEIRSNFADTMAWKVVTTDASGRAVVEVDVPDNLTTWKATARAMTADSRFGQELNSVVCRKEMIVRLETPRFFTQNDETVISAIVHNYLEGEKQVKIEFSAEGIEVAGEKEMIVKVGSEDQKRIDWKATVKAAGKAKITVKALSDIDSDAMQLVIPVLPHGAMKWDSRAGVVGDKVTETIVIPAGSVKGGTEMLVCVSPTHAAMVLDALEYLAGYPYGCVEQTMSRFLPTVVVSQALQKLGIEKPELKAELPAMVSTGLQRLYNFQQQDGGWGWWQHDQSNPWTTAYVMTGLALARESDHPVSDEAFNRGLQALRQHLSKDQEPNTQAYLLYALRMSGQTDDVVRARLTDKLGELNSYSKALLALVLNKDKRPTKEVLESLAKGATVVGGAAHFEGGDKGGWMDHRIEVSAAALRAFIACDPKNELVPKLVSWLSLSRQGNYWASTKQTAMVVYAFVDYLALTGDLNPDMTVSMTLNGKPIFTERITKENWQKFDGMRKFDASQLNAGENVITIEKTGNGSPIYSVYAKYYAEAENMPASQGGIIVERTYYQVIRENGKESLRKLDDGATVTSGDEIEVALSVQADRDYEWLMMDDPLPSGFEPIREYWGHYGWFWNYWYSRKEFHDQKVSIAMTRLWHGNHEARYRMRAETPGSFHALPSQVFNMYHPEIGANSGEFRIRVVDKN
ncbi:MAG TPA: alpha-2-macroglobulin family protein [Planctomycetota bacterium]|nr:alpha-2-macroglobulin family protein [Planctomycetota bacterium]